MKWNGKNLCRYICMYIYAPKRLGNKFAVQKILTLLHGRNERKSRIKAIPENIANRRQNLTSYTDQMAGCWVRRELKEVEENKNKNTWLSSVSRTGNDNHFTTRQPPLQTQSKSARRGNFLYRKSRSKHMHIKQQ